MSITDDVISLNIGGKIFVTKKETLKRVEETLFTNMFKSNFSIEKDSKGNIFFDRDGTYFHFLLNYLRANGDLRNIDFPFENQLLMSQIIEESKFFGFNSLTQYLQGRNTEKRNFNFTQFSEKRGEHIVLLNDKKTVFSIGEDGTWASVFVESPILHKVKNFIEFDLILPCMRSISTSRQFQCEIGIKDIYSIQSNGNSFINNTNLIPNLKTRRNRIGIEVDLKKGSLKYFVNGERYFKVNLIYYGFNELNSNDDWHFTISLNSRDIEISIYDQNLNDL